MTEPDVTPRVSHPGEYPRCTPAEIATWIQRIEDDPEGVDGEEYRVLYDLSDAAARIEGLERAWSRVCPECGAEYIRAGKLDAWVEREKEMVALRAEVERLTGERRALVKAARHLQYCDVAGTSIEFRCPQCVEADRILGVSE